MQDLENKVKHRDKHQELRLGEPGSAWCGSWGNSIDIIGVTTM